MKNQFAVEVVVNDNGDICPRTILVIAECGLEAINKTKQYFLEAFKKDVNCRVVEILGRYRDDIFSVPIMIYARDAEVTKNTTHLRRLSR